MRRIKTVIIPFIMLCLISGPAGPAFPGEIKVYVNVRGTTGLEDRLKTIVEDKFTSIEKVVIAEDFSESHLYIDLSLVEQDPIRFFGLGISIAYHVRDMFYSRPTSDVAQFGEERMDEVCDYLVKEIDKAYLEPLKAPINR